MSFYMPIATTSGLVHISSSYFIMWPEFIFLWSNMNFGALYCLCQTQDEYCSTQCFGLAFIQVLLPPKPCFSPQLTSLLLAFVGVNWRNQEILLFDISPWISGSSACPIPRPFLSLIFLPRAMWTCSSDWADPRSKLPHISCWGLPWGKGTNDSP